VKVSAGSNEVTIKPGEQAIVTLSGVEANNTADLAKVMAWKNDEFRFDSEDLETIMRQLSRWYDIDVQYDQKTDRHFTGIISREVNVSEVLKMLEMTGVMHFEVEGRKVIVTK
jgi:ferric-dicitrate binding protein FerR (iron transport regulator)